VWEVVANGVVLDEFTRPVVQGGAGSYGGGRNGGTGAAPTLDTGGGGATDLLDNFNRANGALGANWVNATTGILGSVDINNNRWRGRGDVGDNIVLAQWAASIGGTNHYAYATLAQTVGGSTAGILVRANRADPCDALSLEWDNDAAFFVQADDNSPNTYLSAQPNAETPGAVYRGEAQGSTQRLLKNGSLIASATNAAHSTNTGIGLHAHTGEGGTTDPVLFDDFGGGLL
jgi:hypothetical protein